ncbi:MAG: PD-(D/E)XK nuclease family protein [Armatimonadetes bacterium]|nr:PD-(D/E)XK nuclease family protein [Armatimonadota bacterium]
MENWQPSTLSWSFSIKTHFNACKRRYFFYRFWGQDPKLKWKLLELRNITTLVMLRGTVTHQVIAESLSALRDGLPVTLESAKERVTEIMLEKLRESYYRLWHVNNRPPGRKISEFTNLLEHYYGFPDTDQRARENRAIALACIENLFRSELWTEIASTDPQTWKATDEEVFSSFDLDGIKVYARPDFAHSHDQPTIIDWKTGSPGEEDREQLVLYSLFAQWKWEWRPYETKLCAVYLHPDLMLDTFTPTSEDVSRVTKLVKASFNEMMELEPVHEKADISRFPPTNDPEHCRWCSFQGVCEDSPLRRVITD